MTVRLLLAAAVMATSNGCASLTPPPSASQLHVIEISRGPCFGFCPVYALRFRQNGQVDFEGVRHAAFIGSKSHKWPAAARKALESQLEPYRPAGGVMDFPCNEAASDQAQYQVVWANSDRTTISLRFNSGCQTDSARRLKEILEGAVEATGFAGEAAQTTRPGASRG